MKSSLRSLPLTYPEVVRRLLPAPFPVRTFPKALEFAHGLAQLHHVEMLVWRTGVWPEVDSIQYLVCAAVHEVVCRRQGYKPLAGVRSYL